MPRRRTKSRRANNDGSIFYRHSKQRWYAQVAYTDADGQSRKLERTAKSREQAQILLVEMQAAGNRETRAQSRRVPLSDWLTQWLDLLPSLQYQDTTIYGYGLNVRLHIVPYLEHVLLQDLTPARVQLWLDDMSRAGLGLTTRIRAFSTLSSALKQAAKRGHIDSNPCSQVGRPSPVEPDIQIFSPDETAAILAATQDDRMYAAYLLPFVCALRQGEVFGLQWDDIDFRAHTIRVERQACELAGKITIKAPKYNSKRTVAMTPAVAEALVRRKADSMTEPGYDSGLVFVTKAGQPIRRSNFGNRHWGPLLKRLAIEHRGLHHARHTCVTTMLSRGVPIHVVSRLIGHRKVSTTLDIYAHWVPSDSAAAAASLTDIGGRCGPAADAARKSGIVNA